MSVAGALTTQFNIGVSTIMVGPMEKVLELTPEEHSLGLVKNFSLSSETSEVTLTQGIKNVEVDSQVTGVTTTMTTEVYEYTSSNLAYAAQLDGSDYVTGSSYILKEDVTGGESATTIAIETESDISAKFTAGSKLQLQASSTEDYDKVILVTVASAAYADNVLTITLVNPVPLGWNFKAGDKVWTANIIPVGSDKEQPYLAAKIVGILPNGNQPVTIYVPKMKITAGMTLGFSTDNYGNLPFEMKPYALTPSDTLYSEFKEMASIANVYIVNM